MNPEELNEQVLQMAEAKMEAETPVLYEAFRDQMDILDESVLAQVRPGKRPGTYDYWALGKQLHQWEKYIKYCEANGSMNVLGKLPNIALDVIAVAYGTSVIPVIASIQPIAEEQGIVWFKNVRFGDTKGTHTADDTIADPKTGQTTPINYASNQVTEIIVASTTGAQTAYSGTLGTLPIRKESISITETSGVANSVAVIDDGNGNLVGRGLSGTINYTTGAWTLDYESDPSGGEVVTAVYQQDYEAATNIPLITQFWDSTPVRARVYALRGTFGMLQSFAMQNRFGMQADEELARDLVGAINAEIGGELIRLINANTQGGPVSFDKTPASGVGLNEHYQSFKIKLAEVEANIVKQAGRGGLSVLIADVDTCAIIETLVGFNKLTDGNTLGAHVFGTLDGRVVVRVTDTAILAADTVRAIWKGPSPFEGPAVWSPFMPLVVTDTLQNLDNPLQSQRAAAVFGAPEVLVPNFITSMTITSS